MILILYEHFYVGHFQVQMQTAIHTKNIFARFLEQMEYEVKVPTLAVMYIVLCIC